MDQRRVRSLVAINVDDISIGDEGDVGEDVALP